MIPGLTPPLESDGGTCLRVRLLSCGRVVHGNCSLKAFPGGTPGGSGGIEGGGGITALKDSSIKLGTPSQECADRRGGGPTKRDVW